MNYLFTALIKKLEGEVEDAKANLLTYQRNSVGIGEHPDIVEAMETQVSKIAEAEDKMAVMDLHYGKNKTKTVL